MAACHSLRAREGQSRAASQARQGRAACTGRPRDVKVAAMHLDLRGHPLHTRALSVTLDAASGRPPRRARGAGRPAQARLRAGRRRAAAVRASSTTCCSTPSSIRPAACLDDIVARQPAVAFEASAMTARRELPRSRRIASARWPGRRLDDAFARRLGEEIGGPRGCSHVLTLAHLLGSTVAWALERDGAPGSRHRAAAARLPPRRDRRRRRARRRRRSSWRSSSPTSTSRPRRRLAPSMDRFAAAREVRALAAVDLGRYAFGRVDIAERRRDAATPRCAVARPRRRRRRSRRALRSAVA